MNYEKLTLARFTERLRDGKYAGLTGARRAIGKLTDWSQKEKDKALEVATKHFESGGASAKRAKPPGRPRAREVSSVEAVVQQEAPARAPASRTRSSQVVADAPSREVHVTTQAELIETAETLRKGLESLEKAVQIDASMKQLYCDQAREFASVMTRLRQSMSAGTRIYHKVITERMVPVEEVPGQQYIESDEPRLVSNGR
jgi:hypothetical protein